MTPSWALFGEARANPLAGNLLATKADVGRAVVDLVVPLTRTSRPAVHAVDSAVLA